MFNLSPSIIISRIIILLIALPVHELAHAWTAHYFGDSTPERNGRLSFNPLAHLDPLGALMLLFAGFGWAKPVPINPYALEKRASLRKSARFTRWSGSQFHSRDPRSHSFPVWIDPVLLRPRFLPPLSL